MTGPRPTLPTELTHLLADLERIAPAAGSPEEAATAALRRSPTERPGRPPKPVPRPVRRSAPDRRSGRDFGPSPRQYNRHR